MQGTISARGGNLGTFQGLVSDDFVVVGTLTAIRIGTRSVRHFVAPIRLRIGFELRSQISLREDQDPEEFAARCYLLPEGDSFCPDRGDPVPRWGRLRG